MSCSKAPQTTCWVRIWIKFRSFRYFLARRKFPRLTLWKVYGYCSTKFRDSMSLIERTERLNDPQWVVKACYLLRTIYQHFLDLGRGYGPSNYWSLLILFSQEQHLLLLLWTSIVSLLNCKLELFITLEVRLRMLRKEVNWS